MFKFLDILFSFAWPFDIDLLPQWCIAAKAAAMQAGVLLGNHESAPSINREAESWPVEEVAGFKTTVPTTTRRSVYFERLAFVEDRRILTLNQSFTVLSIIFFSHIHLKMEDDPVQLHLKPAATYFLLV